MHGIMKSEAGKGENLVVIGGGPGGYPAAIKAAQLGAQVTLIERGSVGGTCLHRGCIPTKFLLKEAKEHSLLAKRLRQAGQAALPSVDLASLMRQKSRVVGQLTKGTHSLLQGNRVRVVQGTGAFVDPRTVRIVETGEEIRGTAVIIATGSGSLWPPIEGKDLPGVLDSDRILNLEALPRSLVIIGGGPIGMEFAQMFHRFGTAVTVLELLPRILPWEDEELSKVMFRLLTKSGIPIHPSSQVKEIRQGQGELKVVIVQGGETKEIAAEKVLIAAGRSPYHESLGLERIGLRVTSGKAVPVNEHLETGVPGVYAIGDVVGGMMLAHKATAEGEIAACNAVGMRREMIYSAIPSVVYTDPEAASVGLSEEKAREKYGNGLLVGRFPFTASSRAMIEDSSGGFVKVLAEPRMQCLVGASIAGPQAGHLIAELALAIQMEATLEDVAETVHAHPTLSEAVREAVLDARGEAVHIPPRTR
jgi:dihydrolipoamide dehydrogenase